MSSEYMRGYSNGQRSRADEIEELKKALQSNRARAERAEHGLGFGVCLHATGMGIHHMARRFESEPVASASAVNGLVETVNLRPTR